MAGKRSKEKGKRFEREIASFLSEIYSEPFERVPNSGAFTGGKNAVRKEYLSDNQIQLFRGDIIPPDDWNIVIECKNYEKISGGLFGVLKGESPQINKWLDELLLDSDGYNNIHILFIKLSRVGVFFLVPAYVAPENIPHMKYFYKNEYSIFTFDKFDALAPDIKKLAKKRIPEA